MSDIIALQTKLNSRFTYREFAAEVAAKPAQDQAKTGLLLSDLFARLEAQAPLAKAA